MRAISRVMYGVMMAYIHKRHRCTGQSSFASTTQKIMNVVCRCRINGRSTVIKLYAYRAFKTKSVMIFTMQLVLIQYAQFLSIQKRELKIRQANVILELKVSYGHVFYRQYHQQESCKGGSLRTKVFMQKNVCSEKQTIKQYDMLHHEKIQKKIFLNSL